MEERIAGKRKARSLCEWSRSNRKGDKRVKKTSTREKEQKDDSGRQRTTSLFHPTTLPAGWNKFQEKIQGKILAKDELISSPVQGIKYLFLPLGNKE